MTRKKRTTQRFTEMGGRRKPSLIYHRSSGRVWFASLYEIVSFVSVAFKAVFMRLSSLWVLHLRWYSLRQKPFLLLYMRSSDRTNVSLIMAVLVSLSSTIIIKHEPSQAHLRLPVVGGHQCAAEKGDILGWPLAELSLRASVPCASPPDDITQLDMLLILHRLFAPLFSPHWFLV